MKTERPDIPLLTVSWIALRMQEMADEQNANVVDGEEYVDRKGQFLSACWNGLCETTGDIIGLLFQSSRR
ncbi:MAG: hypothetical protein KDA65_15155 [Planctomycetaceae bacterium]|nr:hypothetical protein [Planctomycetaceae bacterium]